MAHLLNVFKFNYDKIHIYLYKNEFIFGVKFTQGKTNFTIKLLPSLRFFPQKEQLSS